MWVLVRAILESKFGCRERFSGSFKRFGSKVGYKGRVETTVLLTHITDANGQFVCDHLWFNHTKGFQGIDLREGDVVEFEARVSDYVKGYMHDDYVDERTVDYHLSYPTKIKRVAPKEESPLSQVS